MSGPLGVTDDVSGLFAKGSGVVELAPRAEPDRDPLLREMDPAELQDRLHDDPVRSLRDLAASPQVERELRDRVFGLRRGSWQVMCPLSEGSIVLDLDCGFGAVGRSLARNCGHVIGLDEGHDRLAVSDAVNRAGSIHNFRLALGRPESIESWPAACVDGVVFGEAWGRIARAEAFLGMVRRILRPGGWIYLAVPAGNALGSARRSTRTSFPAIDQWAERLYREQFERVDLWVPLPDHGHADTLFPWTSETSVRPMLHAYGVRKPWKRWVLERQALRSRIPREVGVLATLPGANRPAALLDGNREPLDVRKLYLNQGRASVWYRDRTGERIRDVVLDDSSAAGVRRLEAIARAWNGRSDAPAFFETWRTDGPAARPWMDRVNVKGTPLSGLAGPIDDAHLDATCRQLRTLGRVGPDVDLPVLGLGAALEHFLVASIRVPPPAAFLDRLRACAVALAQRFPAGDTRLLHGDVTPNNVLFRDGRAELIDWDMATPVNFAGYDILNLLRYGQCGPEPDSGFWPGVMDDCANGRVDAEVSRWIEAACGPTDPVAALAAFWILRMARGVGFGDGWIERHAVPSLECAEAWLSD